MMRRAITQHSHTTLGAVLLVLGAAAVVPPRTGHAEQLNVSRLRPYLSRGLGNHARRALEAGDARAAVPLLRRYVRGHGPHRLQARFLLAQALIETGDPKPAAADLARLRRDYPLLADYCAYHHARALYRLKDFAAAEQAAAAVPQTSVLKTDAELIRADALRALGRQEEVIKSWRWYLAEHPGGKRHAEAHYRIAEAITKQGKAARRAEALAHLKEVGVADPLSRFAATAEREMRALAAQLPRDKASLTLSTNQLYARAHVYYRAMRNQLSEQAFAAVLRRKDLDPAQRCRASYYRAKSVFKARQRDRAAPLFSQAAKACRAAKLESFVVKSSYNRARGLMRKRDFVGAARLLQALEREFSSHSYADDALLRAAEAHAERGDDGQAAALLATIPSRYPHGDMAREALWRLAWRAYSAKKPETALKYLERILRELGRARHYYAEGQALYWKARILDRAGKRAQAVASYERCIREYPLSYYSLLAFNRLAERHRRRFNALRRELILPARRRRATSWRLPSGAPVKDVHFRRAVELALLGQGSDAARELQRAGISVYGCKPRALLWIAAALYHRSNLWRLSHQVPRRCDTSHKSEYPIDAKRQAWVVAYPWAFEPFVSAEAQRNDIPPQLVLSVMREESGFSPRIESYANAVGLMQLILPTARAAGARYKLKIDRQALWDPATNIKLGAHYLGWLKRAFSGTLPLTIAGYNAGQGAVYRWLRQLPAAALDELVERIPYDQTRNYTKRVLASYFTYSVLYGAGRVPRIGQQVPRVTPRSFGRAARRKTKKKSGR